MSARDRATAPAKALVRRHVGIWRAMELRNKVVMAPRVPALRRFEDAEVRRLLAAGQGPFAAPVAVVVPTYRRPDGAVRAVESVLAQERQDFVVVVVDDGAGLPSLPADPRVHGVSLGRNTAVLGLVRNVGIRLTSSTYLAFLDDDNTWTPEHLRLAVGALEEGADLVYTAVGRHTADGREVDVLSHPFDRRRLADESYVDANSVAVRRRPGTAFSRLPRVRTTLPKEDWEFVHRTSRRGRVRHVPQVTVRYLVNPESFYTSWDTAAGDEPAAPAPS